MTVGVAAIISVTVVPGLNTSSNWVIVVVVSPTPYFSCNIVENVEVNGCAAVTTKATHILNIIPIAEITHVVLYGETLLSMNYRFNDNCIWGAVSLSCSFWSIDAWRRDGNINLFNATSTACHNLFVFGNDSVLMWIDLRMPRMFWKLVAGSGFMRVFLF